MGNEHGTLLGKKEKDLMRLCLQSSREKGARIDLRLFALRGWIKRSGWGGEPGAGRRFESK